MGFCGACGKKADSEDKFCTGCGGPITEAKVSVLEETGEVIREEYRQSTAPPEAELSTSSHIAGRNEGGWLEYTVNNILKFGGYQTFPQYEVLIDEQTRDKFYVDALATDPYVEIFVECKDYKEEKLPEKILFEFIGQLNHYRKMTTKNVVGVLAMSAKDDSKSKGYREKLSKENAFLWDGAFLEHLQNKMNETQTKDEFHSYIVNHLNIDESVETKKQGDMTFIVRYGFYTVQKNQYIGKKFDVMNILDDIKKQLVKQEDTTTKIVNYEIESIQDKGGNLIRYLVHVDLSTPIEQKDLKVLSTYRKKRWLEKLRKPNPITVAFEGYTAFLNTVLAQVYGINYDIKGKNDLEKLYYEGGRIA